MNRIYLALMILFGFYLAGCQREAKSKAIVEKWIGRSIQIPDTLRVVNEKLVSSLSQNDNSTYTVLRYVDASGCTSCKLQLSRYRDLIEKFNRVSRNRVDYRLIVNPQDIEELKRIILRDNVKYPIYIDNGYFAELNGLEKNEYLHVMLLDNDYKVLAIGDPMANERIMKLYMSILTDGSYAPDENHKKTKLVADSHEFDFDSIKQGYSVRHMFTIENKGHEYFFCDTVITSCECVHAMLYPRTIAPGETAELTVVFQENEAVGEFEREVEVAGNISTELVVKITGNVVK